jgi:hypothetical protein
LARPGRFRYEARMITPRVSYPTLSNPLTLALAVLAFYTALMVVQLHLHHGDVTTFITAGDTFVHREQLTAPLAILPNSPGYDGEFYYRLGLDPFTRDVTAFGITLDNPATRMQRIGYPLLGWIVSLGQAALLPWVLVGLNLTGLFIITWLSTTLARRHGLPTWLGLAAPFYPGFVLTLTRDTTEIAAAAFGFTALFLVLQRRPWRAGPFAAFAVVTRETTLFYLAGFGLAELLGCIKQRRWSWTLIALALPAIVFVIWQWTIIQLWGASSYSGTAQNIGPPFAGLISFFTSDLDALFRDTPFSYDFKLHSYYAAAAAMCVLVCVLAGLAAVRGEAPIGLKLSWVLYLLLIICLTTSIWIQPYDFLRAFSDCFVVSATLVMAARRRWIVATLLAMAVPIWVLTAWFTLR